MGCRKIRFTWLFSLGEITAFKCEQYSHLYTGVRHVLMNIRKDIPAGLRIAGHYCMVHYKGQKQLCFFCDAEGHTVSVCPSKGVAPITSSTSSISGSVVENTVVNSQGDLVNNGASSSAIDLRVSEAHAFAKEVLSLLAAQNAMVVDQPCSTSPSSTTTSQVVSFSSAVIAVGSVSSLAELARAAIPASVANTVSSFSATSVVADGSIVPTIVSSSVGLAETQTVTSFVKPLCSVPAVIAGSDSAIPALDGESPSVGSSVMEQAASPPSKNVAEINSSSSDEGCFSPPPVKLPKPCGGRSQGKLLRKVRSRSKSPWRKSPRPLTLPVSVPEPVVSVGVSVPVPPSSSSPVLFPDSEPQVPEVQLSMAEDSLNTPLTPLTPNLPCPGRERKSLSGPEFDSEELHELLVIARAAGIHVLSSVKED